MSLVSLIQVQKNGRNLKQAIQNSLDLIGYQFGKKIENVVIKPNMCYYWDYSTGQTTDPRFVAALIDVIRSQISSDTTISIVESDASAMRCRKAFKILGYEKIAKKLRVSLVNLSEDDCESVKVMSGGQLFRFRVPKTIQNADLRVNVPKIKYHPHTKISVALKNIYGCNPYPRKFKYHKNLDRVIVALNKVMKFNLCVVDGIIVSGSQPSKVGLIMASRDQVAIDAVAAEIMWVNPEAVRHVVLANREGLGDVNFINRGVAVDHFKQRIYRIGAKDRIMDFGYKLVNTLGLGNRLGLT